MWNYMHTQKPIWCAWCAPAAPKASPVKFRSKASKAKDHGPGMGAVPVLRLTWNAMSIKHENHKGMHFDKIMNISQYIYIKIQYRSSFNICFIYIYIYVFCFYRILLILYRFYMFPDDVCVCPKKMEGGPRGDSSVHQGSTQTPVSRPEDG